MYGRRRFPMVKRLISASVIAALVMGMLPAPAAAAESTVSTQRAPALDLRAAIDRSAKVLARQDSKEGRLPAAVRHTNATMSQGGGGGHAGMMVMMLVGMAASIGGGYLIYKQVKKQTDQAAKQTAGLR
jgi:hypothetical protein